MLRGSALAKTDGKGRLKLPAVFRSAIESEYGSEFFVTSLRGESVRIYPMKTWIDMEERLSRAPSFHPAVMRFKSFTNYYGQTATMDAQGRVLIHPRLRDRAAIQGEVAVIGQHTFLEVWNRAAFEERLNSQPLEDSDLKVLAELGI